MLTRGEAPAAMQQPQLSFRPFVEASGIYDSGLANVALTDTGTLATEASTGMRLSWGISGAHAWKRTTAGLSYKGSFTRYDRFGGDNELDQSFLLGVSQRLGPHTTLRLREAGGWYTRDYGLAGLVQTVPFDPSQSYIPTTDFFDNRTLYATTQADLTIQKTARLSFNLGGDGFAIKRRSAALASAVGSAARGDIQYRLSRRSTIGVGYQFNHFGYAHYLGGSDIHGLVGSYAVRISQWLEFSIYAGAMRVESKFVRSVPVDPVISVLLGITESAQIFHQVNYTPNVAGRLSRTFRRGVAYASGGHSVVPGNGLFLTSFMTTAVGGYTYTGMRLWSFSAEAGINRGHATGNITGDYNGTTVSISASRKVTRSLHFTTNYSSRRYSSGDFSKYNRYISTATVGIGFTPGDVPLRIW